MNSKCKMYCSVPQCHSYKTANTSLHYFPKNEKYRKMWAQTLKIGKPITKYMQVCSLHFQESDFHMRTPLKKRFMLKRIAVPSRNLPVGSHDTRVSKCKERHERFVNRLKQRDHSSAQAIPIEKLTTDNLPEAKETTTTDMVVKENEKMISEHRYTEEKSTQSNTFVELHQCNIMHILTTEQKLLAFCGITYEVFSTIKTCIANIQLKNMGVVDIEKKILLVLIKLRHNLSFVALAVLFYISATTARKYFHETVSLLAKTLECLIYWPSKEENLRAMPKCFENYKDTAVVLDCTEIPVQRSKCLKCRIRTYSYYKSCHTVKVLIGVTPSGSLSFVSSAYGGRTSDKAILLNENVLQKLTPFQDAIMVDKGFMIEKECSEYGIKLVRPPFLQKKSQLSSEDAARTADIARARVHIERAIQRIKTFKLVSEKIEWELLPYLDDIFIIIGALTNLSAPILSNDKFL